MSTRATTEGGPGRSDQVVELDSALWRRLLTGDDDDAFFDCWLALQARQLPGVRNAVLVVLQEDGQLRPVAFWPKGASPGLQAIKAAQSALRRGLGIVRRTPEDGAEGTASAFSYPVKVGDEVVAVCAFTVAESSETDLQAALRRVQWGAVWIERHFASRKQAIVSETADRLATALDLVAVSLEHESSRAAALALMTETATRLDAARASLGLRHGRSSRILAVSHAAQVSRRQNLVRAIAAAMDESIDQQRVLVYPPPDDDHCVTASHRELSQRLGAGGPVITVPLYDARGAFGALTVEYPPERQIAEADVDLIEAMANVSSRVLDLRRREERWLVTKGLASLWRQLGLVFGRGHLRRKLVLLALAAATVFFYYYRTDFRVPARAALEGEVQRVVAAPYDGYIAQEFARPGDLVSRGDVLARLDARELQLELAAWQNRRSQYEAERQSAIAERDIAAGQIYGAQIREADIQLDLIGRKIGLASIQAPFDGVVLSGDLSQALGSGVRLGDSLYQVAPLDSYRVRLNVLEDDIAEVSVGERGELILTSRPERPLPFEVTRMTAVTTPEDGRNYFRVEARLAAATRDLRPGMEGFAKIDAGERRLIWIWTRRAANWLRVQTWKWLP